MENGFDKRVQNAVPLAPATSCFQNQLRAALQDRMAEQRRHHPQRFQHILQMVMIALILASFPGSVTDLGSVDFRLTADHSNHLGQPVYETMLPGIKYAGDTSKDLSVLQQIHERAQAGQEVFRHVEGWRIDSEILFLVDYEYTVDGVPHQMTRESSFPRSDPSEDMLKFLVGYAAQYRTMVRGGQAHYLGAENRIVDGLPARLYIWQIPNRDWGTVHYYESIP